MKIIIPYCYTEEEIPPRCRKPRRVEHVGEIGLTVHEVTADAAPVAIVGHTEEWGKDENDVEGYHPTTNIYRWWRKHLYTRKRFRRGCGKPYETQTAAEFAKDPYPLTLDPEKLYYKGFYGRSHTDYADGWHDTRAEQRKAFMAWARSILFIDGERWTVAGEPRYAVMTYGLGCNHGLGWGTSLSTDNYYNSNISRDRYFRIDEFEQAVAAATATATGRGDTKALPIIETQDPDTFEILIPEAIRLNPRKEHGAGCAFINQMEGIIEGVKSPAVAGLMGMGLALKGLSDRA